jgi:hypothetical protein
METGLIRWDGAEGREEPLMVILKKSLHLDLSFWTLSSSKVLWKYCSLLLGDHLATAP